MLSSQVNVTVRTETDLTTGKRTFSAELNPVPVITPVGPAPGELQIEAEMTGRITGITAVLMPPVTSVLESASLLVPMAEFELDAADLRNNIGANSQVRIVFSAKLEALASLGSLRVVNAKEINKVLDADLLSKPESFTISDLEVSGEA